MTYAIMITKGGNAMDFEIGSTYRFSSLSNERELVIEFLEEQDRYWECDIISDTYNQHVGKMNIYRSSMLMRDYTYKKVIENNEEFDYQKAEYKGVRLNYKDPAVIDLWVDMALQLGDKEWFNELGKYRKELSA